MITPRTAPGPDTSHKSRTDTPESRLIIFIETEVFCQDFNIWSRGRWRGRHLHMMGGWPGEGAGGSAGQLLQLAENCCTNIVCGVAGPGRSVITLYLISWEGGTPPTPHMVTSSPGSRDLAQPCQLAANIIRVNISPSSFWNIYKSVTNNPQKMCLSHIIFYVLIVNAPVFSSDQCWYAATIQCRS